MSNDVVEVHGHTIADVPGRYLLDARHNHFVSDSRFGPAESVQAGELLLSALASCAMANIQTNADNDNIAIGAIRITVTHRRGAHDPTRYDFTHLRIDIHDTDQARADALAARFTATCPIYNTIRRGSGIDLTVHAHP
ncbi:OsmC family protein [Nocardia aurantiaca]|uniref:OsmC family peroxiredoxin n=1 Tax=Nocardia aurantiaca TaxID=2675850 RepID=A0A6I3L4T5_9NOCA|nr:OsmC family peroxiredoxin [Nocardia aurantiaca]